MGLCLGPYGSPRVGGLFLMNEVPLCTRGTSTHRVLFDEVGTWLIRTPPPWDPTVEPYA